MPTTHLLTDRLGVAAQIAVADFDALAAQGFRSIINNRPDGEVAGQPASAVLEAAAQQAGLAYRHLPLAAGSLPDDAQVAAFRAALDALPAPVLAFCRSGHRSSVLWALQAAGSVDAILDATRAAGHDLEVLRPRLGRAG